MKYAKAMELEDNFPDALMAFEYAKVMVEDMIITMLGVGAGKNYTFT